jgi:phosphoribosylamine--glycine ligase
MTNIFIPTMNAMNTEGRPFKGCLYFGLMLTPSGPRVIEYNARFGDPETQVIMPRLKTPLIDIVEAVIHEKLSEIEIEWDDNSCACIIIASGGYPGTYNKNLPIFGLDQNGQLDEASIFHSGTKTTEKGFVTNGGRVLGVTALGSTTELALRKAYNAVSKVNFENSFFRTDIGSR